MENAKKPMVIFAAAKIHYLYGLRQMIVIWCGQTLRNVKMDGAAYQREHTRRYGFTKACQNNTLLRKIADLEFGFDEQLF